MPLHRDNTPVIVGIGENWDKPSADDILAIAAELALSGPAIKRF